MKLVIIGIVIGVIVLGIAASQLGGETEEIDDVTSPDSLPENAKAYLERISQYLDLPISIVSVGPKRSQTVI